MRIKRPRTPKEGGLINLLPTSILPSFFNTVSLLPPAYLQRSCFHQSFHSNCTYCANASIQDEAPKRISSAAYTDRSAQSLPNSSQPSPPDPRLDVLEQRLAEVEHFRDIHLKVFGGMMSSVSAAKKDLVDMRRDLAVCSSLSVQLEKRIENLETKSSICAAQYTLVPELKSNMNDVQQRLQTLSEGCTNTGARLSNAQMQLHQKITHLLEQHALQNDNVKNNIIAFLLNASHLSFPTDAAPSSIFDLASNESHHQNKARKDSHDLSMQEIKLRDVQGFNSASQSRSTLAPKDLNLAAPAVEQRISSAIPDQPRRKIEKDLNPETRDDGPSNHTPMTEKGALAKRKRSPSFEHVFSRNVKTQHRQSSWSEATFEGPIRTNTRHESAPSATTLRNAEVVQAQTGVPQVDHSNVEVAMATPATASTSTPPPTGNRAAAPKPLSLIPVVPIKAEPEQHSTDANGSSPHWKVAKRTGHVNNSSFLPGSAGAAQSAPVPVVSLQQGPSVATDASSKAQSKSHTYHRTTHTYQGALTLDAARSKRDSLRAKACTDAANGTLSRLAYLKAKRSDPSQVNVDDSHYFFARLGKAPKLTPVVVTEGEHMKTSLISEKLADLLVRHGEARRQAVKDNAEDQYIHVDMTWAYDTGSTIEGPGGIYKCFKACQVRFLIVPPSPMQYGAVLAKRELDSLGLRIGNNLELCRQYLSVDGRQDVGSVLLLTLPHYLRKSRLEEPFVRICRLAEWANSHRSSQSMNEAIREFEYQQEQSKKHLDKADQRQLQCEPAFSKEPERRRGIPTGPSRR